MSYVICHMSYVICHMSYVICHMSYVICHISYIIYHISYIIYHISHITYHISHTHTHTREPSCTLHERGALHALSNHRRQRSRAAIQHWRHWHIPSNLRSNSGSCPACHCRVVSIAELAGRVFESRHSWERSVRHGTFVGRSVVKLTSIVELTSIVKLTPIVETWLSPSWSLPPSWSLSSPQSLSSPSPSSAMPSPHVSSNMPPPASPSMSLPRTPGVIQHVIEWLSALQNSPAERSES